MKAGKVTELNEGNETEDFWVALGGKSDYETIKVELEAMNNFDARLFEVSNKSGYTTMSEIPAF